MNNNSLYGNYRTRTFCDIFTDVTMFTDEVKNNGLSIDLKDKSISDIYYLLYANYGNSHIASSDENQFKYKLFSIIYRFGGIWERKLEVLNKLAKLDEDEILATSKHISSHAYNPGEYNIDSNGELNYINEQNKSTSEGSKVVSYANYLDQLQDVTTDFIELFKSLFITVVMPELPLWYVMEEIE